MYSKNEGGTPEYLAPEILLKQGHGKPVDWWTFGCIMYEMLTGMPPFSTQNREEMFKKIKTQPLKLPAHLSASLADLMQRLFEKDPRKRIGTRNLFYSRGLAGAAPAPLVPAAQLERGDRQADQPALRAQGQEQHRHPELRQGASLI